VSDPYARAGLAVELGGRSLAVPYAPADRWVSCVVESPMTIVVGLTSDRDGTAVVERVIDGVITPEDVSAAAYRLLEEAVPYRWWKTVRLLSLSTRDDIVGHLVLAGADPRSLTVAQWCMTVYTLVTRNCDAKERFKTDVAFDDPPPGVVDDQWMSDDDFSAMVAQARAMPGQN
jgi:hypothetical protein